MYKWLSSFDMAGNPVTSLTFPIQNKDPKNALTITMYIAVVPELGADWYSTLVYIGYGETNLRQTGAPPQRTTEFVVHSKAIQGSLVEAQLSLRIAVKTLVIDLLNGVLGASIPGFDVSLGDSVDQWEKIESSRKRDVIREAFTPENIEERDSGSF